jgi:hypothetical protein
MASGGTYRIEGASLNKEVPAPPETAWDEQLIAPGLNAIPINNSYKIHIWTFEDMLGSDYEDLASLYDEQQANNSQLTTLETDPYPADKSCEVYGTTEYTDFVMQSIAPRARGLPLYQSVTVVFEVYVA